MIKSSALPLRAQIRRKAPVAIVATAVALTLTVPAGAFAAPVQTAVTAPVQTAVTAPVHSAIAAAAPVATSAPLPVRKAKTAKPKLKVSRSAPRQVRGETRVKLTARAKHKGKNVTGKVQFRIGKKVLKTKKLKKGTASYKLPKKLKRGTKKVKVTYLPKGKAATATAKRKAMAATSRTVRVKVISQSKAIKTEALKHIGARYRGGGTSPRSGFDCSGFTQYVYSKAGIAELPRSSSSQRYAGKVVSRKKAKVGDIIWSPGHVGIYLGGNKQIDAPRPGKTIQVRSIWQSNPVFINV